jgi:hypothetical protein
MINVRHNMVEKISVTIREKKKKWILNHNGSAPKYLHLGWATYNKFRDEELNGQPIESGQMMCGMIVKIHHSEHYCLVVSDTP